MNEARIRSAAIAWCEDHYETEHLHQIPPCLSALRDAEWWSAALAETPRDGRESNVADPEAPLPVRLDECPDSRSSQAASPRASQVLGDL